MKNGLLTSYYLEKCHCGSDSITQALIRVEIQGDALENPDF